MKAGFLTKLVSSLLALTLVCGLMPTHALAENATQTVLQLNQEMRAEQDKNTTDEVLAACSTWHTSEEIQLSREQDLYDENNQNAGYDSISLWPFKPTGNMEFDQEWHDKIKDVAEEVTADYTSDYDKCKAIHDWVCKNIWYDYDVFSAQTGASSSATYTLATKKGVCAGYASLTVEMLRSIGIPAKKVSGYALGVGAGARTWNDTVLADALEGTNHAWTEAYVNDKWIIIDTTWDSQNLYKNEQYESQKAIRQDYFDISIEDFSKTHFISSYSIPAIQPKKTQVQEADLPTTAEAVPSASTVTVNGLQVKFDSYNIRFNNYFKLRDIAKALSGTNIQFDVTYDSERNAIDLVSDSAYTPIGGELAAGDVSGKNAVLNISKIYLDGKELSLSAYTICNNNFFKLRDLGRIFNFYVGWDSATNTIKIDTSMDYWPE